MAGFSSVMGPVWVIFGRDGGWLIQPVNKNAVKTRSLAVTRISRMKAPFLVTAPLKSTRNDNDQYSTP